MASTTRQLITRIARQRAVPALPIRTCQRSLHTTYQAFNKNVEKGNDSNFAESLTNKFIGQVKRQRNQNKSFNTPTRFVVIEALPPTATTEDIRKLAREAFPKGDKNIVEAVFCRNPEFHFTGRCVVSMSSVEDARRLIEYGHRRTLGGNVLRMNYTGNDKSDTNSVMSQYRSSELISMADSTSASGRSVILVGLPSKTLPEHVLGFLRSRNFFPVDGAPDSVLRLKTKNQSTVSKFLVKFDSESEAWRCVRTFHNTDFLLNSQKENYRLQLSVAY